MFGESGIPTFYEPFEPAPWQAMLLQPRPDTSVGEIPNRGATSALLPLRLRDGEWGYANGSVLIASGNHMTPHMPAADVYDPVAETWERHDMGIPRHHPTAVLLPDGRVLVVAGHHKLPNPDIGRAVYIDPARDFAIDWGTAAITEPRGYHSACLLLPDGRVLVAGGQNSNSVTGTERTNFRYLSPPYVLRPRPVLKQAPATIRYGKRFDVVVEGKVSDAVLVGIGSMTHSFDFNQRHVQLKVESAKLPLPGGDRAVRLRAPAHRRLAAPGVYMLFVLDRRRTPSHARFVRLR